jgi:hypothetical protein
LFSPAAVYAKKTEIFASGKAWGSQLSRAKNKNISITSG